MLIDTNAYSAFKRKKREALAIVRNAPLGVSTVVLGELLYGFRLGTREEQNRAELAEFLRPSWVEVLPITPAISEIYSTIAANLRKIGKPIPTNDIWIAATALDRGADLFTYDDHFRWVQGLRIGKRLADFQ